MDGSEAPFPIFAILLFGSFWYCVYVYGLYKLGRLIATRYRMRPALVLVIITLASALLSSVCLLFAIEPVFKSVLGFVIWITHTQAIGAGFWGGVEMGKRTDAIRFRERAEDWLKSWEHPAQKQPRDGPD